LGGRDAPLWFYFNKLIIIKLCIELFIIIYRINKYLNFKGIIFMTLKDILDLVGKIDDSPGEDTPRERFRKYLKNNVNELGLIRDYILECLNNSGEQFNHALQDLINHIGELLGFEVTYGRYRGVQGEIGFDGLWISKTDFYIVIEVKTTDVYSIRTSDLIGYVDKLISERKIPNWDKAIGLYVVGRQDKDLRQLENNIIAERRTDNLRIISADSLLLLAEIMNNFDVSHDDILSIIKPSGPKIDYIVNLISSLIEESKIELSETTKKEVLEDSEVVYWLTPVRSEEGETSEECIRNLVMEGKIYAFGERTPGRKEIKPGDIICFYATGIGVVAHAKILTRPEKKYDNRIRNPERYPYLFKLEEPSVYFDNPVVIDSDLRKKLDAFEGKDPDKAWAWFVQATRKITKNDFSILTRTK